MYQQWESWEEHIATIRCGSRILSGMNLVIKADQTGFKNETGSRWRAGMLELLLKRWTRHKDVNLMRDKRTAAPCKAGVSVQRITVKHSLYCEQENEALIYKTFLQSGCRAAACGVPAVWWLAAPCGANKALHSSVCQNIKHTFTGRQRTQLASVCWRGYI